MQEGYQPWGYDGRLGARGCLAQLPSMLVVKLLSPKVFWRYGSLYVQGIYEPALPVYVAPQISNDPKPLKLRLSSHVHSEKHWLCCPILLFISDVSETGLVGKAKLWNPAVNSPAWDE